MPTRDERNKFSMTIIEMAAELNISHIEAVTHYCEEKNIEIEIAAALVSDSLKNLIEAEAATLRYLPKINTLPSD